MKNKTIVWIGVLTLGVVLVPACRGDARHSETAGRTLHPSAEVSLAPQSLKMAGISLAEVRHLMLTVPIEASGELTFNDRRLAVVTPRCAGRIETVHAFAGDRVEAGQALASLYSPDFIAAQADFLQIAASRNRAGAKSDDGQARTADQLYRFAREKLLLLGLSASDVARLEESREPRLLLGLRAPFAGSVVESHALAGSGVEAATVLFTIADLSQLWVSVQVFEKDLARLRPGSAVRLTVSAFPGQVFGGRLLTLGDTVKSDTRTLVCRAEVPNPEMKLKPGMYASVQILPPLPEQVLAVPEQAVRRNEGKSLVFVPAGSGFRAREVTTGRRFQGWIEILSGLQANERVVSDGSLVLKSEFLKKTLGSE